MIKLKTVRWKNFLATGNTFLEVKLDKEPMTLIVGKNGAGKSTLIDAITFSLFGKPFKKINKGQLMNTVNEKELVTEIEFSIGQIEWKIRRGIKPALFEIYNNGNIINQDAKSTDYQKYLEDKVLKLNFKSFTHRLLYWVLLRLFHSCSCLLMIVELSLRIFLTLVFSLL